MQWDIGIDLGTAGVRMAQRENGVLFAQSAALAYYVQEKQPFAWGDEAGALAGRTPPSVRLRKPMLGGVLEDTQAVRFWLQQLTQQAAHAHRTRRGTLILSYTPGNRAAHEESLMRAALEVGVQEVGLVRSDVAGAIGAGLEVLEPGAVFVLEVGAGHITATIMTLGRIAATASLPFGFDRINEQLRRTIVAEKAFSLGEATLEELKIALGAAQAEAGPGDVVFDAPGFDLRTQLPRVEEIKPEDVAQAIEPVLREIVFMLQGVVAQIPEELSADLIDAGLTLIGGGARLNGLDRLLGEALGIPCTVAAHPETAVVRGLHEIMRRSNFYDPLVTDRMARSDRD